MTTILKKYPGNEEEAIKAIIKISGDKSSRILDKDQIYWLEEKLSAINHFSKKISLNRLGRLEAIVKHLEIKIRNFGIYGANFVQLMDLIDEAYKVIKE